MAIIAGIIIYGLFSRQVNTSLEQLPNLSPTLTITSSESNVSSATPNPTNPPAFSPAPSPSLAANPVVAYAVEKNISGYYLEELNLLQYNKGLLNYTKHIIDELTVLKDYLNSSCVLSAFNSAIGKMEKGNFSYVDMLNFEDVDGDFIPNRVELQIYHTDPAKIDSDGGGVDDFNEILTYNLDPNNPQDDANFIANIPHVAAHVWNGTIIGSWSYASSNSGLYDACNNFQGLLDISRRDPFVQWLVNRTEIRWENEPKTTGTIYVNNEPIFTAYDQSTYILNPSTYFSNGRRAFCDNSAMINALMLEMMGYRCNRIGGLVSVGGHVWTEADVDGKIYAVDFNSVRLRTDSFYAANGYNATVLFPMSLAGVCSEYDPNWYLK